MISITVVIGHHGEKEQGDLVYSGRDRRKARDAQQDALVSGKYDFVSIFSSPNHLSRLRAVRGEQKIDKAKKELDLKRSNKASQEKEVKEVKVKKEVEAEIKQELKATSRK